MIAVGNSVPRKEAADKVTGVAKYNDDYMDMGLLHGKMRTSTCAHGLIKKLDVSKAWEVPGVRAIITGEYYPVLCGTIIEDHPPIAIGKVRYYGEPLAVVVADSEYQAQRAAQLIEVEYDPLPVINSPGDAVKLGAPLIHENLGQYKYAVKDTYPVANSNINDAVKIRKGDMVKGWEESEMVVEASFFLPKSDHMAMETRNVKAMIQADGEVVISSSTQAPFAIKKHISKYFNVDEGKVIVKVPLVGGAFGGKAPVQLELIAYLASKAVGGRMVRIANTREEDLVTSPCRLGMEAKIKLGASRDGLLKAAEFLFLVDGGGYADITPRMAKAVAVDCTGPYNIPNVQCDSLSVYTNHPYATSYRGFGHASYTYCIERTLDKLAMALKMDPIDIRSKNAIGPGHTTPTQVKVTASNTGDLVKCLEKLKKTINWEEGMRIEEGNKIRAKGVSCFWKTSDSPADAISGVVLTFNTDGSINLNCGVVEYGPGMKTTLAQILAERMKMDVNRIYVQMEVNTQSSPKHWKTVASMTTYMAGRAALRAAEDVIKQLKSLAAVVLRCPPEDLEIGEERVYVKADPGFYVAFKDLVHGYQYQEGNAVEGQIIGRGSFIMGHLTSLKTDNGAGKAGPAWTVGAQAVEVEYDPKEYTYKILKAATVLDAGKVINPKTSRGLVMGGMCMGLGLASRESFLYDNEAHVLNTSLRTYKVMRLGENPQYLVDFVETPQVDSPYGARGFGEHGVIGMPGALANALSSAAQVDLHQLPIDPEFIWKTKTGGAV